MTAPKATRITALLVEAGTNRQIGMSAQYSERGSGFYGRPGGDPMATAQNMFAMSIAHPEWHGSPDAARVPGEWVYVFEV